jgi:hypothetical protein
MKALAPFPLLLFVLFSYHMLKFPHPTHYENCNGNFLVGYFLILLLENAMCFCCLYYEGDDFCCLSSDRNIGNGGVLEMY